jgi:hypothetical protein
MSSANVDQFKPGTRLINEDLAGVDLHGRAISDLVLLNCNLQGADLRGATLSRVDLSLSDLRGALLEEATLGYINASGARLTGAQGRGVRIEHTKMARAELSAADLREAAFNGVDLEGAVLRAANLAGASIVQSNCTDAAFDSAILEHLNTVGSTFRDASFVGASRFFQSREIVAEILRRNAGDDVERLRSIGAILLDRSRCYAQWRAAVDALGPEQLRFALRVFAAYPESGCAEALDGSQGPSAAAPSTAVVPPKRPASRR